MADGKKRATLRDEASQSRYRRVSTRMWNDRKVRDLGHPEPHPTHLFMYLMTNPATTGVPGLFRARDIALAAELGWSVEAFHKAFDTLAEKGMAQADWKAGLVWLPNAVKHDPPASPNVVVSWGKIVRNEMPECRLLLRAVTRIRELIEQIFERPEGFLVSFDKAFPKAFTKGLAEAFQEAFDEIRAPSRDQATAPVQGRANGGSGRLSQSLTESLTRTPTRAQPDAGHPRSPSLRSGEAPRAPQGAAEEPLPPGATDARATSEIPERADSPALGSAGSAQGDPGREHPFADVEPTNGHAFEPPSPEELAALEAQLELEERAATAAIEAAEEARARQRMERYADEPTEADWAAIQARIAPRSEA